ncbi:sensor histidine kinase [Aridibaculum aurantiacum]|uniref:sensor histidine kinase n=1 Tax=Aridibaculum aurantiacum TaxID=2810307 RepID=UPI001F620F33|nr:HAMP domain-containing sensor histidine kinase [Aridibaculum aurantiacum]
MSMFTTRKLAIITVVYWFLLLYIIAALIFWFISLQSQNEKMTELLINELIPSDPQLQKKEAAIYDAYKRKKAQYIGEGVTFLAVIVVGAVFVYRATRRQFMVSRQQQNFMMTVTHELKTPIAVARLNLETLLRRELNPEQQKKLVSNTLQEADRLNALASNILLASQLDTGDYQLTKSNINLSDLAERTVDDFSSRFAQRIFLEEIQDGVQIYGEELLLQMMMNNLVENAIKYSPKDKPVKVTLQKKNNHVIFSVEDEGAGIAEEEQKKLFEKFYRIGNEATRTTKGTGLGLFLCKMIAKDHNGHISVSSAKGEGTTFTVTFRTN